MSFEVSSTSNHSKAKKLIKRKYPDDIYKYDHLNLVTKLECRMDILIKEMQESRSEIIEAYNDATAHCEYADRIIAQQDAELQQLKAKVQQLEAKIERLEKK